VTTLDVDGPHVRFELREYQQTALDRIAQAEERGCRKQLVVAATGLGKTIIFAALAERRGGRTLILAHRDELVAQAAAKVREVWPGVDVGIVKADLDYVHSQVVVASVQTLARAPRLNRLAQTAPFNLVVVDEAHHTAATTYRRVLDAFHAGEQGGPLLLGVTATPDRGDGKGLDDLFDEITYTADMLWGIRAGYLADVRGLRVTCDSLDLGSVRTRHGDYDQGQVGAALEDGAVEELVLRAWREHASDRQTLVFTPTVAVAGLIAERFLTAGVNARWLSGETPLDQRRSILASYAAGRVQVVANCAVLTEGYDDPRTDCIIVARPTKSRALYAQMVGRGTRRHPEKTDLLVLDVVGATAQHSLVTVPSLFGIEEEQDRKRAETTPLSVVLQERDDRLVALGRLTAVEADMFRQLRGTGIAWVRITDRRTGNVVSYERSLGGKDRPRVVVRHDIAGWIAEVAPADGRAKTLIADVELETAQGVAEDFIRKQNVGQLVSLDAPWRAKPPSDRQVAAALKWRMRVDPSWTAGELSDALDRHIAQRKRRG
jgi:superfamily II DNA or RNA helicase